MSKVLLIRHLPQNLAFQDKERLLKHFGAEKVWEISSKRHYIFASFETVKKAKEALTRLHQQEIANRRLVVEYSNENEPFLNNKEDAKPASNASKLINDFLRILNAWNPSVNFYQPPPSHIKYKYPEINPDIAINIVYSLFTHKPYYVQSLHLLNKMCLEVPFKVNDKAVNFFKETFSPFFVDHIALPPPPPESESESEISSEELDHIQQPRPVVVKRKNKLPIPSRKRPPPAAIHMEHKSKKANMSTENVFEEVTPIQEPKKIALVVHQDALQKPSEEPIIVGELGKFEKEEQSSQNESDKIEKELPTISRKELLKNRLSHHDMKLLPVYKNYHPGQPSMRLYIKNLAKSVTEQDVKRIYKLYVEDCIDENQTGFDVRVMQEGRMKGQAFVTFPSVDIAEVAMNETNGYLLKEKPMVVQFARAANKKSFE